MTSILEIANSLLKRGTVRRAAKHISYAQSFIYDTVKGEWIYFFALNDQVKVGYTSNLLTRIKSFRLHTGGMGKFILLVNGARFDEAQIHEDLSQYHITGEWFSLTNQVYSYMEAISNDQCNQS